MARGKKKTKAQEQRTAKARESTNGHTKKPKAAAESTASGDSIERGRETRRLPVEVPPEETAKMAREMAAIQGHLEAKKQEKKETMGNFKEEIDSLESKVSELASGIRTSTELRDIECSIVLKRDQSVEVVRLDTGEVVETRAATQEELQEPMFDSEPVHAPAAKDDARKFLDGLGPDGEKVRRYMDGTELVLSGAETGKVRPVSFEPDLPEAQDDGDVFPLDDLPFDSAEA